MPILSDTVTLCICWFSLESNKMPLCKQNWGSTQVPSSWSLYKHKRNLTVAKYPTSIYFLNIYHIIWDFKALPFHCAQPSDRTINQTSRYFLKKELRLMHSELLMLHSNVLARHYMEKNNDNCGSVSLFNSNTSKLPSKSYRKSILSQVCCPLREKQTVYSNPGCQGRAPNMFVETFIQGSVGKTSHVQSQSFAEELLPKDSIHHSHHRTASLPRFVVEGGNDGGSHCRNTIHKQAN